MDIFIVWCALGDGVLNRFCSFVALLKATTKIYYVCVIVLAGRFRRMYRRDGDTAGGAPRATRRRLSARDVVVVASPMHASSVPRMPMEPVFVTVCKWANKAEEIIPNASENPPVWQLQVVHDYRPSVTFGFLPTLRAYLSEIGLGTVDDLLEQKHFRIVVAGGQSQDPDGVGVKPWRVALYSASRTPVAGLRFLTGFINYAASKPEFAVCGIPPLQIDAESATHFGNEVPEPWQVVGTSGNRTHPFDALPPHGGRHLVVTVEQDADSKCYSLIVSGNTWQYRVLFDRASIPGGYIGDEGTDRDYVRVLRPLSDDEDARRQIRDMLDADVLQGQAVFLVDRTEVADDTFVAWMRTLPSVHYR